MKILKIFLVLAAVAGLAAAGIAGLAVWYFGRDLPDYQALATYQPPIVSRVYAGDGRLMAEYATEKRVFVPVSAIPPLVVHAFLAAEDRNFYSNPGIDPMSILRAAITDISRVGSGRRPEGASTITQQVAKNFLLSDEVSLRRKVEEALIAIRMEQVLSKDRILELYLNGIYLGGGSYGVAAAALHYFNKSLDQLDIPEAAFLAALPKAPNNYNPERFPQAAKERRDWVIDRMADAGWISRDAAAAAKAEPLQLRQRDPEDTVSAPYFTEEVRRELLARYGDEELYQSGLAVRTSLDPRLEGFAIGALRHALIAYDRRHGYRGPVTRIAPDGDPVEALAQVTLPPGAADVGWQLALVRAVSPDGAQIVLGNGNSGVIPIDELVWARRVGPDGSLGPVPRSAGQVLAAGDVVLTTPLTNIPPGKGSPLYALEQIPAVSGGIVALDPHTGRVLAEAGGFSFAMSQFDRVTQAERQTGSAIKPFVYLAAIDHGFTPSTLVLDGPLVVDQGPGLPKWNPTNFEHRFYGPVPLRVGLEQSLNLVTARVGLAIGVDTVGEYLKRFGIVDHVPHEDAMLIGAEDTTLLQLSAGYAMLDNGGKRVTPTFIDRVQDRNGKTIYRADDRACDQCQAPFDGQPPPELPDDRAQIASPQSAYQVVSMMEGVIERGTGRSIASLGRPLAGKTGTTNDSNDTWFVGFSPDLVCGVYIGYDQPASLGKRETGATVAAPAFKEFMGEALQDEPPVPFRIPPGLDIVRVDAATGQIALASDRNAIYEPFKPGTEPQPRDAGMVLNGSEPLPPQGAGAVPASATAPEESDTTPAAPPPATGTGGLY